MSTSDYGRLRLMAAELRTRESNVFRFLLHIALAQTAPLYDKTASAEEVVGLLASLGPELAAHFELHADDLKMRFAPAAAVAGIDIDDEDFELVAAFGLSPGLVRTKVQALLGREFAPELTREAIREYFVGKYLILDGAAAAGPKNVASG